MTINTLNIAQNVPFERKILPLQCASLYHDFIREKKSIRVDKADIRTRLRRVDKTLYTRKEVLFLAEYASKNESKLN